MSFEAISNASVKGDVVVVVVVVVVGNSVDDVETERSNERTDTAPFSVLFILGKIDTRKRTFCKA